MVTQLAAATLDDWWDLSTRDQIYYLLAPVFSVPLALLLLGGIGLWIYRRRHR